MLRRLSFWITVILLLGLSAYVLKDCVRGTVTLHTVLDAFLIGASTVQLLNLLNHESEKAV